MRSISPELLAAQQYKFRTPYIWLIFHNKDDSEQIDYSGRVDKHSRIRGIEHHIMIFGGKATILLWNNDHDVPDLKGYWVDMHYGDVLSHSGGEGVDGVKVQRLWVKSQMDLDKPGVKMIILELQDVWAFLAEQLALFNEEEIPPLLGKPYHYLRLESFTPYDLILFLLNYAGFGLLPLEQDDGMMNALHLRIFEINKPPDKATGSFESFKDAILRALAYTKSYLRQTYKETQIIYGVETAVYEVIYPAADNDVDETYYSYQSPYFKEFVYRSNLVLPSRVLVYCDYDYDFVNPDGSIGAFREPLLVGEAVYPPSIDSYKDVITRIYYAPSISDQWEASEVAESLILKSALEAKGGRLIINHDGRVQLLDKVKAESRR